MDNKAIVQYIDRQLKIMRADQSYCQVDISRFNTNLSIADIVILINNHFSKHSGIVVISDNNVIFIFYNDHKSSKKCILI